MTTLTVTWDSPATDTAYTYAVRLFSDKGVTTFTFVNAANWTNLPWNNDPATTGLTYVSQPAVGEKQYTYTTPILTPGIATGGLQQVLSGWPPGGSVLSNAGECVMSPRQLVLPCCRLLPC